MKKLIAKVILFTTILSTILSCSNNDNPSSESHLLIKKISENIYLDGEIEDINISTFTYESSILKTISGNGYEEKFIYEGNKISRIDNYEGTTLQSSTNFFYDGNQLNYTLSGENQDEKTIYSYASDVLSKIESGYLDGTTLVALDTQTYTFNSALNISESIHNSTNGGSAYTSRDVYTYDSKNNPMKYMNPYLRLSFECEGFDGLTVNNVSTRKDYSPAENTTANNQHYIITYNSDNFPITIKKYDTDNDELISDTTIEYQ